VRRSSPTPIDRNGPRRAEAPLDSRFPVQQVSRRPAIGCDHGLWPRAHARACEQANHDADYEPATQECHDVHQQFIHMTMLEKWTKAFTPV
jgi:hypothetical protein